MQNTHTHFSLHFNGHFPGGPGLAGTILAFIGDKDDGSGGNNWGYKTYKAPVKSSSPTNQHPLFTGRTPFLSPNQQCHWWEI